MTVPTAAGAIEAFRTVAPVSPDRSSAIARVIALNKRATRHSSADTAICIQGARVEWKERERERGKE